LRESLNGRALGERLGGLGRRPLEEAFRGDLGKRELVGETSNVVRVYL